MDFIPEVQDRYGVQCYDSVPGIDGVERIALTRRNDDGGVFMELARLVSGELEALPGFRPAQINYSELDPGVIKAFHIHRRQTDVWFVTPESKLLAVLLDARDRSVTRGRQMRLVLGDGVCQLIRIPPGVAHGIRNLSPARSRMFYLVDFHFDPSPEITQEGRLPWDFLGAGIWEVERQ